MTHSEIHGPGAEINSHGVPNNMGMMPCPSRTKVLFVQKERKIKLIEPSCTAQRSTETRQTRFKEPWLKTKHWTSLITEKNIRQHPKTTREHYVACLSIHILLFSANKVHWQFSRFERNLDALCALCATILLQPCRSMAASVVVKVARVVVVLTWSIQLELPMDSRKKQAVQ